MIRSLMGAVALVALSVAPVLAQDASSPAPTAQPVADAAPAPGKVVCHHDGEIIQASNGPVVCHQRHPSQVTNMSREWLRDQQLRNASMNH
jgi:hypothetical protein